jgi:acyl-CoA thioester hydrolase
VSFSTTSTIRVRYAETDQMRFAYHAHYLVWCEIGRTDFIRELGATYAQLEDNGLFLAVAEAQVRYHLAARYDDVISITCRAERVQSRAITFAYAIDRIEPAPIARLATATTKLVSLDRNGSLRAFPHDLIERFRSVVSDPTP